MNTHDDLPNEAFTDLERGAGVPGIVRGTGFRFWGKSARVTEADCVSLIVRALVVGADSTDPDVVHPDGPMEEEYDLGNLRGLTPSNVDQTQFSVLTNGYRVPVAPLLKALRKTGIPFFGGHGWLAWDEASQSLAADVVHKYGNLKRSFSRASESSEVAFPSDPERARVFQLLRTSYLSSDYGKRPLLIRNEHLAAALAKKPVPFDEPQTIRKEQVNDFSLVHFTRFGDVAQVPLSSAYAEEVAISTRAGAFFRRAATAPLTPSLNASVLRANGFSMSVVHNCQRFKYFLRRNEGTVFQSVFQQIDLPSAMRFRKCDADSVADSAQRISHWATARNAKVYVTLNAHPLESNDCEAVTTPDLYAGAVMTLQELGFRPNNGSSGDHVVIYSTTGDGPVGDGVAPFTEQWKPAGA